MCPFVFFFWQERTRHMIRRNVPLPPLIWSRHLSNDTVKPLLNIFSHPDRLVLSSSSFPNFREQGVPLTAQTNRLLHYGRVCAHICLILIKNDKIGVFFSNQLCLKAFLPFINVCPFNRRTHTLCLGSSGIPLKFTC